MKLLTENNRKWWILAAMSLMLFMTNLDVSIVNLALPVIAHSLNSNLSQLQWVITGYILTTVMFMILGGKLGDVYGHRRIFLFGAMIFTIASVTAGFAYNEPMLIISRLMQGIGGAFAFPLTGVISFAAFPKEQKGLALGAMATNIGVAQAIGPTLGGIILKYLSWHWIFFINLPIGIITILLTLLVCPKYILRTHKEVIDYKGTTLLIASLFFILFSLNEAQNWGLSSLLFLSCFLIGIALLIIFVVVELKLAHPLMEIKIFLNKKFTIINIVRAVITYIYLTILFVLVLYLQNIIGINPLTTGLLLLFMTVAFGVMSPISGKLIDRFGAYVPMLISLLILTIIIFMFAELTVVTSFYMLAFMLLVSGIVFAVLLTATNIVALSVVPEQQIGVASSVFFTIGIGGGMLGVAISGTIMALLSKSYLINQLILHNINIAQAKMPLLIKVANGSHSITKIGNNLVPIVQQSFLHAFHWVMLVCTMLAFVSLVLMLFAKKKRV